MVSLNRNGVVSFTEISKFERINRNFHVFEISHQIGLPLSLKVSFKGLMGSSINIKIIDRADNLIWQNTARILKVSGFENTYSINLGKISNSQFDWTSVRDGDHQKSNHRTYLKHNIEKTVTLENTSVFVYYATDRGKIDREDELFQDYNGERSMLSYGICEVNIPKKRKIGELSRPLWWKFEFQENPNKHFLILGGSELDIDDFFVSLGQRIILSDESDLFVFIHGFNTNFQDAIMRTAQIAYDLSFQGAPVTYSWPSDGKITSYPYDEESVQYSSSHLKDFLIDIRTKTKAEKIHIIAHSMGNRGLTNAIVVLKEEGFFDDFVFNQIILAAPDIDVQVFLSNIVPKMQKCSQRITLYASSEDRALKLSRSIHKSIIRLGESGDYITCCDGIDTVDASNTDPSFLGHGYFASTSLLINDIYQLFRFNHSPENRNLLNIETDKFRYWQFK